MCRQVTLELTLKLDEKFTEHNGKNARVLLFKVHSFKIQQFQDNDSTKKIHTPMSKPGDHPSLVRRD